MSDPTESRSRPRAGRLRAIVVPVAALIALGGAGAFIWSSVRERGEVNGLVPPPGGAMAREAERQAQAVRLAGAPIGEEDFAFWSDVEVFKAGLGRPRPIVVIRRRNQPAGPQPGVFQGPLARELVRQALLLSAREELGALTRDVPIGDPGVAGTPDARFRIGSRFRVVKEGMLGDPPQGRITIVEGEAPARRVVWTRAFNCGLGRALDYDKLIGIVEEFSRAGFREALAGFGLSRAGPTASNAAEGGLPAGVEARLGKPAEEEQFAAIRSLHAAIRRGGETPALLIGLARAYATLGSLSESQWTDDSPAFKARALLYARRATARDRDTPSSLRGRAYAEAVAGLFGPAIRDLDAADKADGGKGAPPWAGTARAYAHTDAGALAKIAGARPDDPWPLYFRALTVSRSSGQVQGHDWACRGEIVAAARALLAKVPDCFRVHDAMAEVGGVSNLHAATTLGWDLYPTAIPARVASVPDLPPGVAGLDDEVEMRNRLVAASAGDDSDLSWGVLARQLREIRFLLACRRIHFHAFPLAADPTGLADEARPLVADHPNRAYIEGWAEGFAGDRWARGLGALDLPDFVPNGGEFYTLLGRLDPPLRERLRAAWWERIDEGTVPGQESHLKSVVEEGQKEDSGRLLGYDPDSPLGRGMAIATNRDEARAHAAAWEDDHGGGDTFVIGQLGLRALQEVRFDEAERLLGKALARSPDRWIFDGLAESFRKRDRMDRWIEAVGDYLKTEDMALDHAHVVGDLAQYLIDKGRFGKARPFAEISAQSGAGWAMFQAARCAEGTGDFDAAERWVARTTARYSSSWLGWYLWCKRTGRGDLRAATDLVKSQLAGARRPSSEDEEGEIALFCLLEGRPAATRRTLERRLARKRETIEGILLALACDKLGDTPARDAAIKAVAEDAKPTGPKTAATMAALVDWIAKGKPEPFDPARIEAIIAGIEPEHRPNSWAVVGLILDRVGTPEDALPYLKRADAPACYHWIRYLVRDALRVRGVEPAPFPW